MSYPERGIKTMSHHTIDFEKWSELAKTDPQAFERLRRQFLLSALNRIDSNKRHKFECLQWRLDQIRHTTKTPLSACMKISQLMWTSFEELRQHYSDDTVMADSPKKSATILPFQTSN